MDIIINNAIYRLARHFFAWVWLINGLFCKILQLVPRHERIVAEILGGAHVALFTKAIGFFEILIAIWIYSGYKTKLNAIVQIVIVLAMNFLEVSLAPHLLLWGKANLAFSLLFSMIVYCNTFIIKGTNKSKKT
jgi:uncharacterized membrane protein YphA (DoxX/SURF4 family)